MGARTPKKTISDQKLKTLPPMAAYKVIRTDPERYGVRFKGSDGTPRCHNFQMGRCSLSGCKFAHVCNKCGGAHPVTACPELGLGQR